MALVCALSGEVPEEPVVSPVSGCVFEKRIITKHLLDNQTDPINNEPLTVEQLIPLKSSKTVRPRAPSATSIPALIKLFQDEWDASVKESFQLRKHVEELRQELSHALYQHDAACRVIARISRERDQARQALAAFEAAAAAQGAVPKQAAPQAGMEVDAASNASANTISAEVREKIQAHSKDLSASRRKRVKPDGLAAPEHIAKFSEAKSFSGVHSASTPGITSLDVHPTHNHIILTGGNDKHVALFDSNAEKVLHTYKGHTKKVSSVLLHPSADVALSGSADGTVRVWSTTSDAEKSSKTFEAGVTGISLHPTGDYYVAATEGQSWSFVDIESTATLSSLADPAAGLSSVQFHPDGVIFGTGATNSVVRIWDLREQVGLAAFEGHRGSITAVSFSENGYYLATAAQDATVKLWDLRKLKNFKTLTFDDGFNISHLDFDYSGSYLAVGGSNIQVFGTKQWDHLVTLSSHTETVTGVKFGPLAQSLVSASLDRHLKIFQ